MNSQVNFNLTGKAILAGIIAAAFPIISSGAAGKVEFAIGNVNALSTDGRTRSLTKGNEINAGDTIQTTDGRIQARFSDGGYISLQPNTQFKVEEYNFNGKADGSEKGFFNLIKGGLRAITGSIGHTNRKAYQVNTPVATIGIRGTEFTALYDTKLLVKVGDGAVYLDNPAGDIILYKGQSGEVGSSGEKPKQSTETPSLAAAGPTGGKPADTQNEQQQQQSVNQIFIAGDVKDENGAPCTSLSSSGGCSVFNGSDDGTMAAILAANASGATGFWSGTSSFSAAGLGSGTAYGELAVNFSNYSISSVYVEATINDGGSYNGSSVYGSTSGGTPNTLNTNGTFSNPFGSISAFDSGSSAAPQLCASGCTLTIHGGSISGANLSTANMSYSFNGNSGSQLATTPISNQSVQMTGGLSTSSF